MSKLSRGIDVGGSHISGALVDAVGGSIIEGSRCEQAFDSKGSREHIVTTLQDVLHKVASQAEAADIAAIGIAMPGPFDYEQGISLIAGVDKFDSIYGMDVGAVVRDTLHIDRVVFENDATCFALGEHFAGASRGSRRSLTSTLGTGFGSTFLIDGIPQTCGKGVPPEGYLYNQPFGEGIADEYFSTRRFLRDWRETTGCNALGVKEIAESAAGGNTVALKLFDRFADNLAEFIAPWLNGFEPDVWVLGGSIAKSATLFLPHLTESLKAGGGHLPLVAVCRLWDVAPIIGAGMRAVAKGG